MADAATDPLDYSAYYNTKLSDNDERRFQKWMGAQSQKTGRQIVNDLYDYDLRGWWRNNKNANLTGSHLPDTYKKPNHPTFSSESRWHGEDGLEGGTWEKQPNGSWVFQAGRTNLAMHGPDELRDYFTKIEPGNTIVFPDSAGAEPPSY